MDRRRKTVIASGLALILFGYLSGLLMAWQANHVTRLAANDGGQPVFEILDRPRDYVAWHREGNRNTMSHARVAGYHTHTINMGILVIVIGLLSALMRPKRAWQKSVVPVFVITAWVYGIGVLVRWTQWQSAGQIIAAVGAVLALIIFLVALSVVIPAVNRDDQGRSPGS